MSSNWSLSSCYFSSEELPKPKSAHSLTFDSKSGDRWALVSSLRSVVNSSRHRWSKDLVKQYSRRMNVSIYRLRGILSGGIWSDHWHSKKNERFQFVLHQLRVLELDYQLLRWFGAFSTWCKLRNSVSSPDLKSMSLMRGAWLTSNWKDFVAAQWSSFLNPNFLTIRGNIELHAF